MARLDTIGFELNSTTTGMEFSASTGAQGTISSSTVRSGSYAGKVLLVASTLTPFTKEFLAAAGTGPYWLRFYLRVHTNPNTTCTVAYLHSALVAATATVPVASIQLTSTGTLVLKDGSTSVGSASSALTADTWYRVDLKIDGSPSSGSRVVEGRLNGSVFATTSASTSTITALAWGVGGNLGNSATATSGEWYFDDIAINDSTGSAQTTYPGDGHVTLMRPAGAGNADFTNAFIEGAGSGNANYLHINETPPDDSTTYLKRDEGAGAVTRGDMYTLTDPVSGLGIGSADTVTLLAVGLRGGSPGTASSSTTRNFIARLKSKSGGTASDGSSVAFNVNTNTTGWQTNAITSPRVPLLTSYTDPDTGVAWTVTGTNSLTNAQAGYHTAGNTGNTSNGAALTALWVTVETVRGPVSGTMALTGGGTLAETGVTTKLGTAAISSFVSLQIAGTRKVSGTLAIAGGGVLTLTQQGVATVHGTLTLTGGGTLAAAGAPVRNGTLALSGQGVLTTTGVRKTFATLALAGGGSAGLVQRVAVNVREGGGAWSSSSSLRLGGRTWTGTASLSSSVSLAMAGHQVTPPGGILQLRPGGRLTASGTRTVHGVCALAGGGTFRMTAQASATSDRLTLDRSSVLTLDRTDRISVDG